MKAKKIQEIEKKSSNKILSEQGQLGFTLGYLEALKDIELHKYDVSGAERNFCPSCNNKISVMQYECKCGYHFIPE